MDPCELFFDLHVQLNKQKEVAFQIFLRMQKTQKTRVQSQGQEDPLE